jgi:hypothetical protein
LTLIICQYSQCGIDLPDGAMAKLSSGIPPLLEESVKLCDTLANGLK